MVSWHLPTSTEKHLQEYSWQPRALWGNWGHHEWPPVARTQERMDGLRWTHDLPVSTRRCRVPLLRGSRTRSGCRLAQMNLRHLPFTLDRDPRGRTQAPRWLQPQRFIRNVHAWFQGSGQLSSAGRQLSVWGFWFSCPSWNPSSDAQVTWESGTLSVIVPLCVLIWEMGVNCQLGLHDKRRVVWLKEQTLTVSHLGSCNPRSRCLRAGPSWGLSWACRCHLLPLSSRGRPPMWVRALISSSYKDNRPIGSGSHTGDLISPNNLCKDAASTYSDILWS